MFAAVNYTSVLARGFTLTLDATGAPIPKASAVAPHQALRIRFADGEVAATADGHAEPAARRGKPKAAKDGQGSLF